MRTQEEEEEDEGVGHSVLFFTLHTSHSTLHTPHFTQVRTQEEEEEDEGVGHSVLFRFRTLPDLHAWMTSSEREAHLLQLQPLLLTD